MNIFSCCLCCVVLLVRYFHFLNFIPGDAYSNRKRDRALSPFYYCVVFLLFLLICLSARQRRIVPSMEWTAATHTPIYIIINTQDYWHDTCMRGHSQVSRTVCASLQGTRTHANQTAYRFQREEHSKRKRWVGLLQVHCLESVYSYTQTPFGGCRLWGVSNNNLQRSVGAKRACDSQ